MVTKLAELAIVVSLVTLSQRLTGYENKPLGYLLLAIAIGVFIVWAWELYGSFDKGQADGISKKPSITRKVLTAVTAMVLIGLVVYPWFVKPSVTSVKQTPPVTEPTTPVLVPVSTPTPVPAPTQLPYANKGTTPKAEPPKTQDCSTNVGGIGNHDIKGADCSTHIDDLPPKIIVTNQKENVPSGSIFVTTFLLDITATKAFLLHVRAMSPDITGDNIGIDNVHPPEQGGMAFWGSSRTGAGFVEEDFRDTDSGAYIVTVRTSKPSMVRLDCR